MGGLLSHAPFPPKGGVRVRLFASWLLPSVGQAQRSLISSWDTDLSSFYYCGEQPWSMVFISVDKISLSLLCDWVLLTFSGDRTLQCLLILRVRKHVVPTTTLDGCDPGKLMTLATLRPIKRKRLTKLHGDFFFLFPLGSSLGVVNTLLSCISFKHEFFG